MSASTPALAGMKTVGPMAAAGALVIAAGAFLLPLPGLAPPAWTGPQPEELAKGSLPSQPKGPPPGLVAEAKDWSAFSPMFDKLRDPIPAVAEVPKEPGPGEPGGVTPTQTANPIPWHYRGFIREPSRLVALVELPEGQRLLVAGETVPEQGSHGESIEVLRIEPDQLVVRRAGGKEETLKVEASAPDSEANRRTLTPQPSLGRR